MVNIQRNGRKQLTQKMTYYSGFTNGHLSYYPKLKILLAQVVFSKSLLKIERREIGL